MATQSRSRLGAALNEDELLAGDIDALSAGLGFRRLRQDDCQEPILEVGGDPLPIHGLRQSEGTLEPAIAALGEVILLLLLLTGFLGLAAQGQDVLLQRQLDILLLEAW